MQTLSQHNQHYISEDKRANVLCDKCNSEMYISSRLTGVAYEFKREVYCADCGYVGYMEIYFGT